MTLSSVAKIISIQLKKKKKDKNACACVLNSIMNTLLFHVSSVATTSVYFSLIQILPLVSMNLRGTR